MPSHTLSERRKRGLSQGKAKKIARDGGFKRLGDGFDSPAQKLFIRFRAGGGLPTRMLSRNKRRRSKIRTKRGGKA